MRKSIGGSAMLRVWVMVMVAVAEASACARIQLQSSVLGRHMFAALPDEQSRQVGLETGRASYVSSIDSTSKMFLYHVIMEDGGGRWVMSDTLGEKSLAVGYVDSWAIMPTLIHSLDGSRKSALWSFYDGNSWTEESGAFMHCVNSDTESAFYLEVHGEPWFYSGYYVETGDEVANSTVYSMVANSVKRYLYKIGDNWIMSGEVGSTTGEAFVEDAAAKTPAEITNRMWHFGNGTGWSVYDVTVIAGDREATVVRKLHLHRKMEVLPAGQTFFQLSNGIAMPSVGLGTGGLPKRTVVSVIRNAFQQGYRLLDMSREYYVESKIPRIISAGKNDSNIPLRSEVFLVSKVWPTHLGFHATTKEIYESMRALQTPYVDMYMINWPSCNTEIEWMHCETSEDPLGTWKESWYALERAYAEGHISSIGVSNFDHRLLSEFENFGTILPHAVQNPAQPGNVDMAVREWCSSHNAVFMPYSTQRNYKSFPKLIKSAVKSAALNHNVSPNAIISRFFVQSGAAIIPRSAKSVHLQENLDIHSFVLTNDEMKSLGWPHVKENSEL